MRLTVPPLTWNFNPTDPKSPNVPDTLDLPDDPAQWRWPPPEPKDFRSAIPAVWGDAERQHYRLFAEKEPNGPVRRTWIWEGLNAEPGALHDPYPLLRRDGTGGYFLDAQLCQASLNTALYGERDPRKRYYPAYGYQRGTRTGQGLGPGPKLYDEWTGPRGLSHLSPYCTIKSTPGSRTGLGFTGVSWGGMTWHCDSSGNTYHQTGWATPAPWRPESHGCGPPLRDGQSKVFRGILPDGEVPYDCPVDLAFHPTNKAQMFVVDFFNNAVRLCDHPIMDIEPVISTFARIPLVCTIDDWDADTLVCASRIGLTGEPSTIWMLEMDGSHVEVAKVPGDVTIVRKDIGGNLLYLDQMTHQIWRLDPRTGQRWLVVTITRMAGGSTPGIGTWFDVDLHGTCGMPGDIETLYPGTDQQHWIWDTDGQPLGTHSGGGPRQRGVTGQKTDFYGHYPGWVHRHRFTNGFAAGSGFGTANITVRRINAANEPVLTDAQQSLYRDGRYLLRNGTPFQTFTNRPGYVQLMGGHGSMIPVTQHREVATWTDEAVLAFLQKGGDGGTPNPALTLADAQAFRYAAVADRIPLPEGRPPIPEAPVFPRDPGQGPPPPPPAPSAIIVVRAGFAHQVTTAPPEAPVDVDVLLKDGATGRVG